MISLKSCITCIKVILLIMLLVSCDSDIELTSGLEGQVIRGPINGGPEVIGQINYEPFSAFFHITGRTNTYRSTFNTDENGEFSIQLPPGNYYIIPDKTAPLLGAELQRKEVTVFEDSVVSVVLNFDTGIR